MTNGVNQLIANPQTPNFLQSLAGGLQARQQLQTGQIGLEQARQQQQRQQRLSGIQAAGGGVEELARGGFTERAANLQKLLTGESKEAREAFEFDIKKASALIQPGTTPQQFESTVRNNFPAKNADAILKIGQAGVQGFNSLLTKRGAGTKAFAPITLINNQTGEKRLVSPTVDPQTGQASLAPFQVPEGFQVSTETPEEERSADILAKGQEARAKVTGKTQAERRALAIEKGIDAADSFANVQRGLDLLDSIPTGGIDAVSLRAKQLFGVEGADEAELSNRLGKAVLAQLRTTFGAAFTEREGARLSDIEAGFGKSTEGNRRLLEQTKRLIERAARRGIRAARAQKDLDSVEDIEESLKFRFTSPTVPATTVGRFQVETE